MVRRCPYVRDSPGDPSFSIIIRSFFFHLRVIFEGISFLPASKRIEFDTYNNQFPGDSIDLLINVNKMVPYY